MIFTLKFTVKCERNDNKILENKVIVVGALENLILEGIIIAVILVVDKAKTASQNFHNIIKEKTSS